MNLSDILWSLRYGVLYTAEIFALTLAFSLPLGLAVCFGRLCRLKPVSLLFRFYISVMRGTPLMLQLFVAYFLPYYAFGIPLKRMGESWLFIAVIAGFSLNYAAYFAEIFRGGITSVDKGQHEAAAVLGFTRAQTFSRVIFPQVLKRVTPAIANEIITLVKDTSLAFAIGQAEMFTAAKRLASKEVSMLPYLAAAIVYYALCLLVAFAASRVEKRLSFSV